MRPQYVNVLWSRAVGCLRNLLYILQQRTVRIAETGLIQLSLSDGLNCLLVGSLNTQEVGMRVQSIWTAIQPRYPACDRFLRSSIQVPLRKVDRVTEAHDLTQEVGPMTKALKDSRHLLTA